jgi:hypothetical protein
MGPAAAAAAVRSRRARRRWRPSGAKSPARAPALRGMPWCSVFPLDLYGVAGVAKHSRARARQHKSVGARAGRGEVFRYRIKYDSRVRQKTCRTHLGTSHPSPDRNLPLSSDPIYASQLAPQTKNNVMATVTRVRGYRRTWYVVLVHSACCSDERRSEHTPDTVEYITHAIDDTNRNNAGNLRPIAPHPKQLCSKNIEHQHGLREQQYGCDPASCQQPPKLLSADAERSGSGDHAGDHVR